MTPRDDFLRCAERGVGVYRYCSPSIPGHCWDCSGYVRQCWAEATGRDLSGDSHQQFTLGRVVSGSLQPGDLVFFDAAGGREVRAGNRASHVAIYVGDGQIVNALNESAGIVRGPLDTAYWRPIRIGNRRYFDDAGNPLPLGDASQEPPVLPSDPGPVQQVRGPRRKPEGRRPGRLLRRMVELAQRRRSR
jgi:hypothetical protein